MTRLRVLVSAPYFLPVVERFRPRFARHGIELVTQPVEERLEAEQLLPIIDRFDGALCGDDRFTRPVLERARRLQVIAKWGTGVDSIDREACRELGIKVCNTPDAFSQPVADSVLGYALAFARSIASADRAMKDGRWRKLPGHSLSESTFGIIGVGNIGRRVAQRLVPFGAQILGTDIRPIPQEIVAATGMEVVDLEELLRRSDFVSLNCDLNPTSRHLIDAEKLGWMKPTAVLINTARGPLVYEAALCRALAEGRLGGAGLDVFEEEPLPPESPLYSFDNVLLAPHNANSSPRAWEAVHENTVRNLLRVLTNDA